jgi:hypothetical protein
MRLAIVLLAALLLGAPAAAQPDPGAPPGATADSRRAARALGEVTGIDAQLADAFAAIHSDLLRRVMQQGARDIDVAAPIVDTLLMPGFTARRDELEAALLEPWAANFTPGELRLLRSFFASPLGQRYLHLQATLASQAAERAKDWSDKVFRQIIEDQSDELLARGLRF